MNTNQHRRLIPVLATTALVVALSTLPAAARPDPGPAVPGNPATIARVTTSCALERVGTQFVACDNLTGNGVPAPAWVPER